MKKITVYGIPNCDTIKKTMAWFAKNKIAVDFHDYKKEGITKDKLTQWGKLVDWEIILNKKSTTWRGLSTNEQAKIINQTAAIKLMIENTSIIKRPVVEYNNKIWVGFNETEYKNLFK